MTTRRSGFVPRASPFHYRFSPGNFRHPAWAPESPWPVAAVRYSYLFPRRFKTLISKDLTRAGWDDWMILIPADVGWFGYVWTLVAQSSSSCQEEQPHWEQPHWEQWNWPHCRTPVISQATCGWKFTSQKDTSMEADRMKWDCKCAMYRCSRYKGIVSSSHQCIFIHHTPLKANMDPPKS